MNSKENIEQKTVYGEDIERSGRSSTSKTNGNIKKMKEKSTNNSKLANRKLAEDLNILINTYYEY